MHNHLFQFNSLAKNLLSTIPGSPVRAHKIQVAELQATVADSKAQQVIAASYVDPMHNHFPQFHRQRRSLDFVSLG
jgi:hypothetical protein